MDELLESLLTWREIEEEWMNEAATQDIPDAEFALDVLNYQISELAVQAFLADWDGCE